MIALIIIGCVLLLFVLLFTVHFFITLDVDKVMSLSVRVLCFRFKILPKKEKKYKLRKYTLKKIRRREKKAAKKAARAALRRKAKADAKALEKADMEQMSWSERRAYKRLKKASRPPLRELIPLICRVLKLFCSKLFGKVHIKVARLNVYVGSSDAMKAAVLYGVVNQSVQYLMEGFQKFTHVDGLDNAEINIAPDFLSEKIEFNFNMTVRVSLGNLLGALIKAGWRFLKGYMRIKPDSTEYDKLVEERRKKAEEKQMSQKTLPPAQSKAASHAKKKA